MTAIPIATPPAAAGPSKFESFLVKYRVHVGFLIAAGVLIEGVIEKELPLDWTHPRLAAFFATAYSSLGLLIRLISLGTIRKNESLATKGIYSRCRHPLYFGSALLFVGLGIILNDGGMEFWYLGVPYILLFYTAAVARKNASCARSSAPSSTRTKPRRPRSSPTATTSRASLARACLPERRHATGRQRPAHARRDAEAMVYLLPKFSITPESLSKGMASMSCLFNTNDSIVRRWCRTHPCSRS